MKSTRTLLVAALAAAGMAVAFDAPAQEKHGARGGHHGGRHHGGHFHGHRHWYGPRIGLAIGVPLGFGWGWGPGWYGDPYYYGPPVVYREREVIREVEPSTEPATTEIPRGEGAPAQGPLYMNYCESARAYFPKVQRCPEGWKFISPTQ
jgi:hypothetical protein